MIRLLYNLRHCEINGLAPHPQTPTPPSLAPTPTTHTPWQPVCSVVVESAGFTPEVSASRSRSFFAGNESGTLSLPPQSLPPPPPAPAWQSDKYRDKGLAERVPPEEAVAASTSLHPSPLFSGEDDKILTNHSLSSRASHPLMLAFSASHGPFCGHKSCGEVCT